MFLIQIDKTMCTHGTNASGALRVSYDVLHVYITLGS